MNPAGLHMHDPRVLYRWRSSRRKGISSLVIDRALPDNRLLFAQPGYRIL
jgi:hypothetical protein